MRSKCVIPLERICNFDAHSSQFSTNSSSEIYNVPHLIPQTHQPFPANLTHPNSHPAPNPPNQNPETKPPDPKRSNQTHITNPKPTMIPLTTLPRATAFRNVDGLFEDDADSSTSSSASNAAAWRIESASCANSSIASMRDRDEGKIYNQQQKKGF